MPRIRSIKYEFFINEDVASVSYPARLLFIGLWTLADRDGRLEERLARIKAQLFSYDPSADIETWLEDLDECGVLSRYTVENKDYIQIKNFAKHQKPHPKEPDSTLPAVEKNGKTRKRRKVQPTKNEKGESSRRSFNGLMVSGSMVSGLPEHLASQVPAAIADDDVDESFVDDLSYEPDESTIPTSKLSKGAKKAKVVIHPDCDLLIKTHYRLIGPISNHAAQRKAINWLLKHYPSGDCIACLTEQVAEVKDPTVWRKSASWLTVQKDIGNWKIEGTGASGNGNHKNTSKVDRIIEEGKRAYLETREREEREGLHAGK